MWWSNSKRAKRAYLIAEGPLGVKIEIVDGRFQTVATGTGRLIRRLDEGVYVVRWSAGGLSEQQVCRLRAILRPLWVTGGRFELDSATPNLDSIGRPEAGLHEHEGRSSSQARAVAAVTSCRSGPGNSEIVIFVRSEEVVTEPDVSSEVRLYNLEDTAMRSDRAAVRVEREETDVPNGWAARVYSVPEGDYRLRFRTVGGELAEQALYAIRNRRTVVFLQFVTMRTMVAHGEAYQAEDRVGVDPGQSTIVSIPDGQPLGRHVDAVRLADILLHGLAGGDDPLDDQTLGKLLKNGVDPYAKLYGALLLVKRLEMLGGPANAGGSGKLTTRERLHLQKAAESLLCGADGSNRWPDTLAIRWKLEALGAVSHRQEPLAVYSPPMLELCWRWLSACSIEKPGATPAAEDFLAAADARLEAYPWLAWQADANVDLKAAQVTPQSLQDVAAALTNKVERLSRVAQQSSSDVMERSGGSLLSLSPEAQRVANSAIQAASSGMSTEALVLTMAQNLGAPAASLERRIRNTVTEIERIEARPTAASA